MAKLELPWGLQCKSVKDTAEWSWGADVRKTDDKTNDTQGREREESSYFSPRADLQVVQIFKCRMADC